MNHYPCLLNKRKFEKNPSVQSTVVRIRYVFQFLFYKYLIHKIVNMPPKRPYGRPPGLKGRDIGLYYKSLQMKKGRKEQQPTINLKIPRNVTSKIEHNLTCIKKLARELQIPIKPMDKLYLFEASKDNATSDSTSSDKGTCSMKMDIDGSRGLKQSLKSDQPKSDNPSSNATNTQCDSGSTDMKPPKSSESIPNYKKPDSSKGRDEFSSNLDFIKIGNENQSGYDKPGTSKSQHSNSENNQRQLSLRETKAFKYGYEDIIKDSFDDKLDECLARDNVSLKENEDLNLALYEEYKDMMTRKDYKRLLQFREILPAFKNSEELLKVIKDNQVVVISGETGCGKSTQVPQIILDDALSNKTGSKVKVLVTQPRRIAASSLAKRVSEERGERMGNSVGYAVRLEKVDPRPHGSIQFCTTGILLTELEVDQGLGHFSHVILDEVHERDTHIDLALCMLKKVLNKRKDLKLILMSATIDAEKLSEYFSNCPMMHIEGLAYPVKDIYLEDILMMTKYRLPVDDKRTPNYTRPWQRHLRKNKLAEANIMETDIKYRAEIGPWLESKKSQLDRNVFHTLLDARIEELNIDLIYELLKHICKGDPGAILVFLPGIGDITKLLRKMTENNDFPQSAYEIYPLHSKLPSLEQHKIFERPPSHIRKIIVATNIAETSITIDDIVYVVDCGKIKYSGLNIEENVSTLKTEWVSQANLRQRRGRAGRCQPGICYHLVTSFRAEKLEERLKPEIQRTNLLEAVLTVKRLRLGKAEEALNSMPAPPAISTIQSAITHLQKCGALDSEETLTPLGWHLARLPVHPAAGKLLLLGALFGCLDRAASVAAVWGFKDPFLLVIGKEQEVDEARRALAQGEPSDHVAMSEAIINWEMCSKAGRRNFAYDNFLSNNTIEMLSEMKKQFGENLKQMGFLASGNVKSAWENRNSDNFSLFKAIVAAALYPNIATVKWINLNARNPNKRIRIKAKTPEDGPILLHPSSVMANGYGRGNSDIVCVKPGANWLVYWLKQRSSDLFLIDVTLVYTLPLLFFGELNITKDDSSTDCLMSISTIKVRCNKETTQLLYEMRSLLDQVLASKITSGSQHSTKHNQFDEKVLNAVIEIITAEDERAEFMNESDMSDSDQSECGSSRSWYK